jgi:heptosyltransferase-2
MSLPALAEVRARWSSADIAVLARPYVAALYEGQGVADRLLLDEFRGRHGGLVGRTRLARELREEHFDVALLLTNSFDSAWVVWRAGIPERIGYARDARSALLTAPVPVPRAGEIPPHEPFYYLELLRRAGWIDRIRLGERIALRISEGARTAAEKKLVAAGARSGATRVAVGPGASYGSAKCWLPGRFAELADWLIETFRADVILFGASTELTLVEAIVSAMRNRPVNLAGQTSIAELPAFFSVCRLFIGNDSGAMHVAAAVGLPVVGIFGPTDAEGTAPATPERFIVQNNVHCAPCFLRRCPIDHRCMEGVTVSMVESAAASWLDTQQVPRG